METTLAADSVEGAFAQALASAADLGRRTSDARQTVQRSRDLVDALQKAASDALSRVGADQGA